MIFLILTPVPLPPAPHPGTPFFWWGLKFLCVLWPLCVYLDLGPKEFFFLYMDPLTHDGGPGSQLQVPPVGPPHMAPCR